MCAGFLSRGGALTAALYGFLIALKDMRLEYIIILTIQVFTVIFQVMLCPIAPPKGFPSVYGARLAHRPLETFGCKFLDFS